MSLYNMIHKANPATFFILPMLGKGHYSNYPRFRDCWVNAREWSMKDGSMPVVGPKDEDEDFEYIYVFTRVGGGNRESYRDEIEELRSHKNYITDYDDSFDSTYATFKFSVPEKWKDDYQKVLDGQLDKTSKEYQSLVLRAYRDISDTLKKAFSTSVKEETA